MFEKVLGGEGLEGKIRQDTLIPVTSELGIGEKNAGRRTLEAYNP